MTPGRRLHIRGSFISYCEDVSNALSIMVILHHNPNHPGNWDPKWKLLGRHSLFSLATPFPSESRSDGLLQPHQNPHQHLFHGIPTLRRPHHLERHHSSLQQDIQPRPGPPIHHLQRQSHLVNPVRAQLLQLVEDVLPRRTRRLHRHDPRRSLTRRKSPLHTSPNTSAIPLLRVPQPRLPHVQPRVRTRGMERRTARRFGLHGPRVANYSRGNEYVVTAPLLENSPPKLLITTYARLLFSSPSRHRSMGALGRGRQSFTK